MEIPGTKRFIPKGFELGTILGPFIREKISRGLHKARHTLEERAEQTASRGGLLSRFLTCAGKLW